MPTSSGRIVTSHAGSLPRPEELIELNRQRAAGVPGPAVGGARGPAAAPGAAPAPADEDFQRKLSAAVTDVVARQLATGVDLVNDGEYGHSMDHRYDFGPWWTYVFQRLAGLEMVPPAEIRPRRTEPAKPREVVLATFPERRDWVHFSEAYGDPNSGVALPNRENRPTVPVCRAPVTYRGTEQMLRTIANFTAALAAAGRTEGFLNAVGPASCARFANEYYSDDEELLYACADAMRAEYEAIIDAGLVLQIDDPAIAENWDQVNPAPTVEAYQRFTMVRVEALNHALRGLPAERIRFHLCWGSWHGPHVTDLPMADIIGILLSINANAYSFEAANVRHEHEWKVWRDVKLPDGRAIIPGVIDSTSNFVEHPELVADRIVQYAGAVGRDNVIAGADCGFGTFAGRVQVDSKIVWMKLASLAEGARLASKQLWQ
jgi:5-methyltetrahydropteroyltriglutamate--homocysteine methyltransferase